MERDLTLLNMYFSPRSMSHFSIYCYWYIIAVCLYPINLKTAWNYTGYSQLYLVQIFESNIFLHSHHLKVLESGCFYKCILSKAFHTGREYILSLLSSRLNYRYHRLIDEGQMRNGELPASEVCTLEEGEEDDEEVENSHSRFTHTTCLKYASQPFSS